MIYPANFEEKTGFDRIRRMLKEFCYSSLGIRHVEQLSFQTDKDLIKLDA